MFSTRQGVADAERCKVVYQFSCNQVACNATYIGYTTQKLSNRVKQHRRSTSSIYKHFTNRDGPHKLAEAPPWTQLINQFEILFSTNDVEALKIAEGILIKQHRPLINVQNNESYYALKLFWLNSRVVVRSDFISATGKPCNPVQSVHEHFLGIFHKNVLCVSLNLTCITIIILTWWCADVCARNVVQMNILLHALSLFYSRIVLKKLNVSQLSNYRYAEKSHKKVCKLKADLKHLKLIMVRAEPRWGRRGSIRFVRFCWVC